MRYFTWEEDEAYRDGYNDGRYGRRDYYRDEHFGNDVDKAYYDGLREAEREEERRREMYEQERQQEEREEERRREMYEQERQQEEREERKREEHRQYMRDLEEQEYYRQMGQEQYPEPPQQSQDDDLPW